MRIHVQKPMKGIIGGNRQKASFTGKRTKKYTHWKSNQGNQDSSGNQKNVIQGKRPDMENQNNAYKVNYEKWAIRTLKLLTWK